MSTKNIEQDLSDLIVRIALVEGQPLIRSQAGFEERCRGSVQKIGEATQIIEPWLAAFSEAVFATQRELESTPTARYSAVLQDVKHQISYLTFEGFMSVVPWKWLEHYPRYFKAIAYRLDKIRSGAASRDTESMSIVSTLWAKWLEKKSETTRTPTAAAEAEFRWMLEELRVGQFAQPLGTSVKVSPQRCEKLL